MSDNIVITPGIGATVATDDVGGVHLQKVKLDIGGDGVTSPVTTANPLPISDAGGTISVDDGAGSLTVDNATLSVTGGGVEASALRVTLASDSTGLVSVDDNGGSLTVDGTVAATQSGTWNARMQDGSGNALTSKAPGSERALSVAIVDGSGNQVTSFVGSGGTSMTDDAPFTPASTAITPIGAMFDDVTPDSVNEGDGGVVRMSANRNLYATIRDAAGNERGLNVDASGNIGVTDAGGVLTVDGTVAVSTVTTSITPGTAATHLGKAEDAAHVSGDTGVMSLAVRQDSDASFANSSGDYAPLQLDSSGFLKVRISAGAAAGGTSATDDSAFTPASGSGTPIMGFADETTPDAVDEGDVGVVRMTLQRALHVNLRDASGAELTVGGAVQYAEDTVHASGDQMTMAGAVRRNTAASGTSADGDVATLNVDTNGKLWTNAEVTSALPAGTNNIGDVDVLTLPALATGSNTIGAISSITTGIVAGTGATNLGKAEDDPHTSADTGVFVLSRRIDTAATSSGTSGDYSAINTSAEGAVWTTPTPSTTSGLTIFRSLDLDETEEEVKATAGNVYGLWFSNLATSTRFLKFYNATAATVVVGTTTPVITLALPGNASDDISGVFATSHGISFGTAITVAATTGAADADTGAPGADEVIVNVFYK